MAEKLDYDEETFKEKLRKRTGFWALIGTGLLSILHTLSHLLPAIGVLGLSLGDESGLFYRFFSNELMQLAYIPFVFLSFWYIYRDHKHHQHERALRMELEKVKKELARIRRKKKR